MVLQIIKSLIKLIGLIAVVYILLLILIIIICTHIGTGCSRLQSTDSFVETAATAGIDISSLYSRVV